MLKMEYLFENFDLAREALKNYAHDEARLAESLNWFRISSNAVYPYFDGENLCFLRLCPAGEKPDGYVEAEIEFIDYLIANNFPAMEPPKIRGSPSGIYSYRGRYGFMAMCFMLFSFKYKENALHPSRAFDLRPLFINIFSYFCALCQVNIC